MEGGAKCDVVAQILRETAKRDMFRTMNNGFSCHSFGQVAVRRTVEFHLTDWFDE